MRNNGRNTVKTRLATRNTYSSRNSSSTRYGRNTYSSSRNYGSRNYSNYGMNNAERGYYSSNRYNYTSEALDYATDAGVSAPRKPKRRIVFARAREVAPLSLVKSYGTIELLFTMALVNLIVFASNSTKRDSIVGMQEQVATLQEENMFLENSIEESLDLKKIENEAVKLGLQKPAEYQIMHIKVPKESYTVQYSQSNANESYLSKVWSKIQRIFEG